MREWRVGDHAYALVDSMHGRTRHLVLIEKYGRKGVKVRWLEPTWNRAVGTTSYVPEKALIGPSPWEFMISGGTASGVR